MGLNPELLHFTFFLQAYGSSRNIKIIDNIKPKLLIPPSIENISCMHIIVKF